MIGVLLKSSKNSDLMRKKILVAAILLIAIFLRFYQLDLKPLHHDESVHTYFVDRVLSWNYVYDPAYHGPFLFYLTSLVFLTIGKSDFSVRIIPAIFGVLLVFSPILLRDFMGYRESITSSILLSISPLFLYYSRFFRNDIIVCFLLILSIIYVFKYLRYGMRRYLIISFASLAFFACSKENFYPIVFLLSLFFLFDIKKFRLKDLAISALVFLMIYTALYSRFFTDIASFLERPPFYLAITHWIHMHEIERIGGPFYYYIPIMVTYDIPILIFGFITIFKWILRERKLEDFKAFLIYWFIISFLFYSYVQEKVPWLTVHILLPLYIMAGYSIPRIGEYRKALRISALIILILTIPYFVYSSALLNFVHPADPREPAVYVQTSPDVKRIAEEIRNRNPSEIAILVTADEYWPLPWYLGDLNIKYYGGRIVRTNADVIIANETQAIFLDSFLKGYEKEEFRLRCWVVHRWENAGIHDLIRFIVYREGLGDMGCLRLVAYFKA